MPVPLLERIEEQLEATHLRLFAITVAAVPYPDTPIILTLHWHGFAQVDAAPAQRVFDDLALAPIPSSALQLNAHWESLSALDRATLDAAWKLGAWDVSRAERPGCVRQGAAGHEAMACLQAFGAFPFGIDDQQLVVAEAPDAAELLELAAWRGYLMWLFRPVRGGIWGEVAADATLDAEGGRPAECPHALIPPTCEAARQTVCRLGITP